MKTKTKNELLFRKAFIPWYDTEPAMAVILLFTALVFSFSIYGIVAAFETSYYLSYIWVPVLLAFLALLVIVFTSIRMIKRGGNGSNN